MSTIAVILALFVLLVAGSFLVLALTGRLGERAAPVTGETRARPRGSPLVWVGVWALFALLGLVVAPRLLGGVVLLLPFVWVRRRKRSRPET